MRAGEIEAWVRDNMDHPRVEGVSAVDLLDLPPALNQIVRVLLSGGSMTLASMRIVLETLPDTLWGDTTTLQLAVDSLVHQSWLVCISPNEGEHGEPRYRVNLRAKARTSAASGGWESFEW
jgi:hypothetical protein